MKKLFLLLAGFALGFAANSDEGRNCQKKSKDYIKKVRKNFKNNSSCSENDNSEKTESN